MAFRFDARFDSSDEGENTFNLSTLKAQQGADEAVKLDAQDISTQDTPDDSLIRDQSSADEQLRLSVGRRTSSGASSSPVMTMSSTKIDANNDSIDKDLPERNRKLIPVIDVGKVDRSQYEDFKSGYDSIRRIVRVIRSKRGEPSYECQCEDFHVEELTLDELIRYRNGQEALDEFTDSAASDQNLRTSRSRRAAMLPPQRRNKGRRQIEGFVSTVANVEYSDESSSAGKRTRPRRQGLRGKSRDQLEYASIAASTDDDESDGEESEDLPGRETRSRAQQRPQRNLKSRRSPQTESGDDEDDSSSSDGLNLFKSDLPGAKRRKVSRRGSYSGSRRDAQATGTRQSGRSTRHTGNMEEIEIDNIYRDDAVPRPEVKPKSLGVKEVFRPLPRNNEFRMRHNQFCDTCGQGSNIAALIDCQGCSLTYHKSCLGHRSSREHLVTKLGDEDFVLQCRRCVGASRKKERTSPDQGRCSECHQHGVACVPFRPTKTPAQEMKERDENYGVDPIYNIDPLRINNASNVLFRCLACFRGFHFEHLPSRSDLMELDAEVDVEQRFREYSRDWMCKECLDVPGKVSGIIAWKPVDEDNYDPALGLDALEEEARIYLLKWEGMSYFRARWMPGPWVWGTTAHSMRKAFAKREDAQHPKMRTEDAIPEDYLRADIVLDIKYTSIVDIRTEEIDKARIREVDQALIKYKGLGYQDAVWEAPPAPEDGDRWLDFVSAYHTWIAGRYVRQPRPSTLRTRIEKARSQNFETLERQTQPDNLEGGKLMEYQMQGVNWLYYKWITQKNAILADEMGLGKTIQIIGFFATLVKDFNCFPFLVVVPNSTCPNWRREIKQWAPSLRVVAYYGVRESRDLIYRYELHPEGSKELRCHIVVTSYEAAADENCRKFFKSISWQALVIDEGQRLKNDKNQLYAALSALKAPFKILLTGTPLQNNQRELFNLLHFLDDTIDATELEERYADLDQEKINELHEMIRPFFLRRTKAQVLTFLPPMAQIIVPVSMTIVQKKLYRNILAKNPDLMRAVFSTGASLKQGERASLNNILMQLRKCLCHPFVYNKGIEERNISIAASHRNLVDASSKLKLLELILPKLKADGHRVLIFSQFLDMLDIVEDFLDGIMLPYHRLDGNVTSLKKQRRIDDFNAPDSQLFAFLLSTRSGGVGINLATADTVIILDPDFNPHQDIQALARAHRIGQKNKVLCLQLVTRSSAEERMMQMGRKKLALDHVLITQMDEQDDDETDMVSILRHGAAEIFNDDGESDIHYDLASVEKLLDRSQIQDSIAGGDKSAETLFSQARVWAIDQGELGGVMAESEEQAPDPGLWANILRERERLAAEEAASKAAAFGRGHRARANVDYKTGDGADASPSKNLKKRKEGDESDTDFQANTSEDEDEDVDDDDFAKVAEGGSDAPSGAPGIPAAGKTPKPREKIPRTDTSLPFRRAVVPHFQSTPDGFILIDPASQALSSPGPPVIVKGPGINCRACSTYHPVGNCPLKLAGVELCNLCGLAHFGQGRVCPHISSETQVRAMLEALNQSNEPETLKHEARKYLRGLKGSLVQMKKHKAAAKYAAMEAQAQAQAQAEAEAAQMHLYGGQVPTQSTYMPYPHGAGGTTWRRPHGY